VDDREVSHEPDVDVVGLETRDLDGQRRLLQEALPIDERSVGKGAEEIVPQNLLEPLDLRGLDRADANPG
jgi:hypothetical protein